MIRREQLVVLWPQLNFGWDDGFRAVAQQDFGAIGLILITGNTLLR